MRQDLPKRTVTFLFTDVEASTRLLRRGPERYAEALADPRRVLRDGGRLPVGATLSSSGEGGCSGQSAAARVAPRRPVT